MTFRWTLLGTKRLTKVAGNAWGFWRIVFNFISDFFYIYFQPKNQEFGPISERKIESDTSHLFNTFCISLKWHLGKERSLILIDILYFNAIWTGLFCQKHVDEVFKSGPSKFRGRKPLKYLKGYGLLSRPYPFKIF